MHRRCAPHRSLCLAVVLTLCAASVRADEMLFYTDKNGNVIFTNTVPVDKHRTAKPVPRLRGGPAQYARPGALPATIYDPYIDQVARDNGVDPSLVKAVALVESGFNPKAVSNKGARGLMQLLPSTAKQYGVSDLHDPYQNLRAGAAHLRDLLDEFDGNVTLALAAYNAGSGAVHKYGGVPNYQETQQYVKKIENSLGRSSPAVAAKPLKGSTTKILMTMGSDGSITLSN
ncbi:MAG TPA: lytic transglycosylase domain-containing protein [Candidatus Polarisedimenticolaceae bacterium]|nr:lytic transglycosylase domain-containing protein [Candidatus Polarisedimenticolaceae bacterium]